MDDVTERFRVQGAGFQVRVLGSGTTNAEPTPHLAPDPEPNPEPGTAPGTRHLEPGTFPFILVIQLPVRETL